MLEIMRFPSDGARTVWLQQSNPFRRSFNDPIQRVWPLGFLIDGLNLKIFDFNYSSATKMYHFSIRLQGKELILHVKSGLEHQNLIFSNWLENASPRPDMRLGWLSEFLEEHRDRLFSSPLVYESWERMSHDLRKERFFHEAEQQVLPILPWS